VRRDLVILVVCAAALFTASMDRLSLPALDDCAYARKGVEMARSGRFYTVTWHDRVTTQHPPLQFWLLGRSFALFGENDFAARLPSVLMALGILLGVFRIGALLWGPAEGATAAALLLVSPYFVGNARRCMLDIPLAFWVVAAVLILLEGRHRPWTRALLALPLGAAILTKSVLGLLPLLLLLGSAPFSTTVRGWLRGGWIWVGVLGGLAWGASWIVHQWLSFGTDAVMVHIGTEVVQRSTAPLSLLRRITDYPKVLVESFEPVAPLAVGGAWLLARRLRAGADGLGIVAVLWGFLPVVAYSFSAARSPRYLFPIFPGLALCAAFLLVTKWARAAAVLRVAVVPVLALAAAGVLWVEPSVLRREGTAQVKTEASRIREWNLLGSPVPYLGDSYWGVANPMLYYAETLVEPAPDSADEAVAVARSRPARLLVADRSRLGAVTHAADGRVKVLLENASWALLRVKGPASR
jgi:4-amino-4-deoxy-L-arabinose transferase-like glycosyltransferase